MAYRREGMFVFLSLPLSWPPWSVSLFSIIDKTTHKSSPHSTCIIYSLLLHHCVPLSCFIYFNYSLTHYFISVLSIIQLHSSVSTSLFPLPLLHLLYYFPSFICLHSIFHLHHLFFLLPYVYASLYVCFPYSQHSFTHFLLYCIYCSFLHFLSPCLRFYISKHITRYLTSSTLSTLYSSTVLFYGFCVYVLVSVSP